MPATSTSNSSAPRPHPNGSTLKRPVKARESSSSSEESSSEEEETDTDYGKAPAAKRSKKARSIVAQPQASPRSVKSVPLKSAEAISVSQKRKEDRRERNRLAAQVSRQRKADHVKMLEDRIAELETQLEAALAAPTSCTCFKPSSAKVAARQRLPSTVTTSAQASEPEPEAPAGLLGQAFAALESLVGRRK